MRERVEIAGMTKQQMAEVVTACLHNIVDGAMQHPSMQKGLKEGCGHHIHYAISETCVFNDNTNREIRRLTRKSRGVLIEDHQRAFNFLKSLTQPSNPTEDTMARKTKEEKAAEVTETETETQTGTTVNQALLDAVADVNKVFGLKPAIDVNLPEVELEAALRQATTEALPADEKDLDPGTWSFLRENGMIDHLLKKEEPAEKKKDAKPKAAAKKGGFTKQPDTDKRNQRIEALIAEGKHTAKEITDMVAEEFPNHKRTSIQTLISDSKNPKYNKFDKLAVQAKETKILSFAK